MISLSSSKAQQSNEGISPSIWVFGYGSLMWDSWENAFACRGRTVAAIHGFQRIFNKASVKNWGSQLNPGPTLNITPQPGAICHGTAFEFPSERRPEIMAYLRKREGGFALQDLAVHLPTDQIVQAVVPLYHGKNILQSTAIEDTVNLVLAAKGSSGACVDYVYGIAKQLSDLGIEDHAVRQLVEAIRKAREAAAKVGKQ